MSVLDHTDDETNFTLYFGSIFGIVMDLVLVIFPIDAVFATMGWLCIVFFGVMLWWLIRDGRKQQKENAAQDRSDR